jgi:large repetitive protein
MRTVPPRSTIALLAAVVAALVATTVPAAASAAEGDIIVKYTTGADAQDRADARADAGVVRDQGVALPATEVVTPREGTSVHEAVADLNRSPDVAHAEPDRVRHALDTYPSEAQFDTSGKLVRGTPFTNLWGLTKMRAPAGWDVGTGSSDVTVAVVDSGVDRTHPDLFANLVPGHDFAYDDNDPTDYDGHGTHVTGTIAARGNNGIGVTGVAWQTSIEPLQALDATGSGSVSDIIDAYDYAGETGARIVNASFGGGESSDLEKEAIARNSDVLFVVAAGNDGANDDNSATSSYPCAYDLPNVLCVAASDSQDHLASWSNYGAGNVDIAAPGVNIYSTTRCGGYGYMSGTSMATPEVSGAAALLLAQDPTLTPAQVRDKLMSTADPLALPEDRARIGSGGRLDVARALGVADPTTETASAATSGSGSGSSSIALPTKTVMTTREDEPQPPAQTCPAAPLRNTTGAGSTTPVAPAPATPAPATPVVAPVRTTTPTADRTAPTVSAALTPRGALRALLAGKLRVSAVASERGSVRVELRIDRRTAKRLHLAADSSTVVIATGSATLTKAGTKSVTVRLSSKAKRALKSVRTLKATLRATATDAAGNHRTRSTTVTITR